jgi:hypothetical protein
MESKSVNVTIANYTFVCVRLSDADFNDTAAVYVILCVAEDRNWKVLDVGQSSELGSRIDNHERKACWLRNCPNNNIWVCVYSMPSDRYSRENRVALEKLIRQKYAPPCGER